MDLGLLNVDIVHLIVVKMKGEKFLTWQTHRIHCAQNPIRSFADLKETRNVARNNEWQLSLKKMSGFDLFEMFLMI